MDLLLLNDRLGGRIKEGGVVYHRFIKPNRRLRGTEYEQKEDLSDTFLSSVGTRMLMDGPVSARKGPVNTKLTQTSSDQNPMFLIDVVEPPNATRLSGASINDVNKPLKSVRSLYNERYEKELSTSAGRALREHIGGGHNVLMDSTPRAQRVKKELARKLNLILDPVPESNNLSPVTIDHNTYRAMDKTARSHLTSRSPLGTQRQSQSSRAALAGNSARSNKSSEREYTGRTSRSVKERDRLNDEMKALEAKLNKIENLLEVKSSRSNLSKSSRYPQHQK